MTRLSYGKPDIDPTAAGGRNPHMDGGIKPCDEPALTKWTPTSGYDDLLHALSEEANITVCGVKISNGFPHSVYAGVCPTCSAYLFNQVTTTQPVPPSPKPAAKRATRRASR